MQKGFFIHLTLLAVCLVFGAHVVLGEEIAEPKATVLRFGIFETKTQRVEPPPGAPNIEINRVGPPKLVESTTKVPGELGISFGFQYRIDGQLEGKIPRLTVVIRHPPKMRPGEDKVSTKTVYRSDLTNGVGYVGMKFDEEWEILPGDWDLTVHYKGKELCGVSFTVLEPK